MIFTKDGDFTAFERVMAEALERWSGDVRLLAYCLMGNHWHLVLRTSRDGVLSAFMKWLTLTHTQRYQVSHGRVGDGPVYRGRFKSFVIEQDRHFLTVCRYVERNPVRAGLLGSDGRAEDWRWSSLWRSRQADPGLIEGTEGPPLVLSDWPVSGGRPRHWLRTVNTPLNDKELQALRQSVGRSQPYGNQVWRRRQIERFGIHSVIRPQGRPRNPD